MTDEEQPTSLEQEEPISEERPKVTVSNDNVRHCYDALEKLSEEEEHTLLSYAHFKALSIRGMVYPLDARDLLHEAIARTLDGRRKWDPERIDFVTHLIGCMRSIASELLTRKRREVEALEEYERREWRNLFDSYWPEQILRETRIRLLDNEIAVQVFDRLLEGYKRAEICQTLNMRIDVYDAARKRITRCLYALAIEWGENPPEPLSSLD
jgi:DNA-directed RNA polymerase specialized sigma24 family protein